ncbi:flagellar FlbD family protein [candidate division KSB1 bacterium]
MIKVIRINDREMVINAEMIEFVESTPDTIISLSSGKKILVKDTVDEVISMVMEYRRDCFPYKKYRITQIGDDNTE